MFGPRITTVFRSKWRALWFVASVLLGVWYSVPKGGGQDDVQAKKDAEAVAAMLNQQPAQAPDRHVNPWAKSPPQTP